MVAKICLIMSHGSHSSHRLCFSDDMTRLMEKCRKRVFTIVPKTLNLYLNKERCMQLSSEERSL